MFALIESKGNLVALLAGNTTYNGLAASLALVSFHHDTSKMNAKEKNMEKRGDGCLLFPPFYFFC